MKRFAKSHVLSIAALLLLLAVIAGCGGGGAGPIDEASVQWEFYNGRAEGFVTAMSVGDFDAAADMFDSAMRRALPVSVLEDDVWDLIVMQAGAFVSIHEIENMVVDRYFVCFVTSRHETSGVTLRVVFSEDGSVSGLFIDGYPTLAGEITFHDGFTDFPVIIGEGTAFPLNGILSMPNDAAGETPAAVIVHGSGAQDMDMTLFANKPYRDIAEYLASSGIAVIRYDKRTLVHGESMDGSSTVWQETIEDAILAAEILKADPRIDEDRVFIIGHSLGGMLAPRIHAEGGNFAGLILLAGSPRFLLDISKTQNLLFIETMADSDEKEALLASLDQWDDYYGGYLALPDDEARNTTVPGWGVSAYYFKDLYANPASAFIEGITEPFLVLQGSNDLQVLADVDFVIYQELLAKRPNATFKLYDGLNHIFMPSGISDITELMDEYAIEGHVDRQVLADIAAWIKGQAN